MVHACPRGSTAGAVVRHVPLHEHTTAREILRSLGPEASASVLFRERHALAASDIVPERSRLELWPSAEVHVLARTRCCLAGLRDVEVRLERRWDSEVDEADLPPGPAAMTASDGGCLLQ